MEGSADQVTVQHGGMTLTTVGESASDIKASLGAETPDKGADEKAPEKPKSPKERATEAARELGKRGGKAAAEKRAEAKPAEDAPEPEKQAKPAEKAEAPEPEAKQAKEAPDEDDEDAPLSKRARQRVERATRQAAEHRREAEALRARLLALEAHLTVNGQGKAPRQGEEGHDSPARSSSPAPQGRPDPKDFESYDEYVEATVDWKVAQREHAAQRHQHATNEATNVRERVDSALKHIRADEALRDEIADEVGEMQAWYHQNPGQPVTIDNLIMGEILFTDDSAPAILRHLSKNPEELARLRALGSRRDAHPSVRVEVQILARTLGSKADATAGDPPASGEGAPKRPTSKAPPPVRPVTGAPHVVGDPAPREGESFDAWRARNRKRA